MKRARCSCGKAMTKYSAECKDCRRQKIEVLLAKANAIVQTGVCPDCGSTLRCNLSLTGWWQCSQFGAEGFRSDNSKAACGFQTFTE